MKCHFRADAFDFLNMTKKSRHSQVADMLMYVCILDNLLEAQDQDNTWGLITRLIRVKIPEVTEA